MPRLAPPDPSHLSPEQQRVHDAIVSGPRGVVEGPVGIWLHSPEFADLAQNLGRYCRFDSLLPKRLLEIAILVTAAHWRAKFEWWAHSRMAREAGVPDAVIEAIYQGRAPDFEREDETLVYAFTRALHEERRVPDDLYARAVAALGTPQVVDLTGVLGYYTLVSMTLNVFEVPVPEGAAEPFAA